MSEGESFFSRWSQRKQQARESKPAPAQEQAPQDKTQTASVATPAPQELPKTSTQAAQTTDTEKQEAPLPTLADVQALTPNSDFSRFVGAQVDPEVRHAAMRKLFSDPHFNVMDGLDVYIEDYNKTTPLPLSKLKQLASAKVLGLVQESVTSKPKTGSTKSQTDFEPTAQTTTEISETSPDADPDLRLQQDDAAGPESTGDGARGDADTA